MTSPTPSEPRTGQELYHGPPLTPGQAAGVTAAAIATIYGAQLALRSIVPGLVASMIADALVVIAIVVYARRRHLTRADLGVRSPRGRFVVAAVLLGLSVWYLTAWLVVLVNPPGNPKELEKVVESAPLVPTLVALTLFPAVAEELVFRGILARTLAARAHPALAVLFSALAFGAFHLFPPQMLSTFALGLVLAFLTLRAKSIVPSMIVHVLNNTVAIVLPREVLPDANAWISDHPASMLVGSTLVVGCGLVLAARGGA